MNFTVSGLIALIAAGLIYESIAYAEGLAQETVMQYNLRQISKVLDVNLVSEGKYPATFDELIASGDLKNVTADYKYTYLTSEDRQKGAVLAATDTNMWCWQSEDEEIKPLSDPSLCKP